MNKTDFIEVFNTDLGDRKVIIIVARCKIEYWGRSRSVIGSGDRLIMIKSDSTLIVHAIKGFKPLNWMSAPADTVCEKDEGNALIFSQRTTKPFEEIKIQIEKIIDYNSFFGLLDGEKIEVTHTEHDMRDYLAKNPHLVDKDFRLKSVEYKTPLGLFDLYGKIGDKYCIVELKSQKAGLPAVLQLKRYRDWLREHLRQDVVGILMAPSVAANPKNLLKKEGLLFQKFNVNQVKVERHNHSITDWV